MGAKSFLLIALVALATLGYLVYLGATYEPPEGTTTVVMPAPQPLQDQAEPPQPIQRQPAPAPAAEPEPAVVEQAEPTPEPQAAATADEAPAGPDPVVLPSLNLSDGFITARLQQIPDGADLIRHLADQQLIRNFVVLVDNISRGNLPQNNLPYREVSGDFPVRTLDDNLFELDPAGFRRFDQAVNALVALDTEQAVGLYRLARPLFQQAYAELGYQDEDFDLALRRAFRSVLETDEVEGPLQLVKPSVMYLYADSGIEAMSDIQKQMIRIGPENREKVKSKLRQVLQQL